VAQIESSTVKPSWNLSCSVLCSRCRSKQPLPNKHAKGTWISTYVNTCKHHVSWSLFERMRKGILPHFPSKSTQRSSHTGALVRKAKAVDAPRLWTWPSKAGWLKGNIYEGLQAWPFQGSNQHISTLHPSTNGVTPKHYKNRKLNRLTSHTCYLHGTIPPSFGDSKGTIAFTAGLKYSAHWAAAWALRFMVWRGGHEVTMKLAWPVGSWSTYSPTSHHICHIAN